MLDRGKGKYLESYGAWAGNPKGRKPNLEYCCIEVTPNERGGAAHRHQCRRKRGYGPNSAYCKQHDPAAVAKRHSAIDARADAAWLARRYEFSGKRFYDALVRIAEGHNDPRGLAQRVIDDFTGKKPTDR